MLPCIAELAKLPLRELSLVDIQLFSDSAAFLAPFQQLPHTLRQLLLTCGPPETWQVIPDAELLPRASLPARLQTTALRRARSQCKLVKMLLILPLQCAYSFWGNISALLSTLSVPCISGLSVTSTLVARRKLELVATEVADVTLAGVLRQLVLLTVRVAALQHTHAICMRASCSCCAALRQMVCAGCSACAGASHHTANWSCRNYISS